MFVKFLKFIRGSTKAFVNRKELTYAGHKHTTSDITSLDTYIQSIASSVSGNCSVSSSSYIGNDTFPRTIIIGSYVICVMISVAGGLATSIDRTSGIIRCTSNGFTLYTGANHLNGSGATYPYVVFIRE